MPQFHTCPRKSENANWLGAARKLREMVGTVVGRLVDRCQDEKVRPILLHTHCLSSPKILLHTHCEAQYCEANTLTHTHCLLLSVIELVTVSSEDITEPKICLAWLKYAFRQQGRNKKAERSLKLLLFFFQSFELLLQNG